MVKHSPLPHGTILHARTLWTAANPRWISAAGFYGAMFLAAARAYTAGSGGLHPTVPGGGGITAMAGGVDCGDGFNQSNRGGNIFSSGTGPERRLRSRPLTPLVSVGFGSAAGLASARRERSAVLGMAGAAALYRLWGAARGFGLVCGSETLRKRRRLHRSGPLLFFAGYPSQQHIVVCPA